MDAALGIAGAAQTEKQEIIDDLQADEGGDPDEGGEPAEGGDPPADETPDDVINPNIQDIMDVVWFLFD